MSSSPAWIDFLKRTLGHEDQLHPGTPVYERRRQLNDSVTASWNAHLGQLVQSDLLSGAHGRRKHFWEEMECLVVYELVSSVDEDHVASRDYQKLASLALHATYVFCPGFSGKSLCVSSNPTLEIAASRPMAVRSGLVPISQAPPNPALPFRRAQSLENYDSSSLGLSLLSLSTASLTSGSSLSSSPISIHSELEPECPVTKTMTLSASFDTYTNKHKNQALGPMGVENGINITGTDEEERSRRHHEVDIEMDWSSLFINTAAQASKDEIKRQAKCLLSEMELELDEHSFLTGIPPLLPVTVLSY